MSDDPEDIPDEVIEAAHEAYDLAKRHGLTGVTLVAEIMDVVWPAAERRGMERIVWTISNAYADARACGENPYDAHGEAMEIAEATIRQSMEARDE